MDEIDTNANYLRSLVELAEAEERYTRHEITDDDLKQAHTCADLALLALEKDWAAKDAQMRKETSGGKRK